jgi:hypothetical protein
MRATASGPKAARVQDEYGDQASIVHILAGTNVRKDVRDVVLTFVDPWKIFCVWGAWGVH